MYITRVSEEARVLYTYLYRQQLYIYPGQSPAHQTQTICIVFVQCWRRWANVVGVLRSTKWTGGKLLPGKETLKQWYFNAIQRSLNYKPTLVWYLLGVHVFSDWNAVR